jgi:hypothetical protein
MAVHYDDCLHTTSKCIATAERCAAECGTSGDVKLERCAVLARDCADVGALVHALMLRGSPYAADACLLHARTCEAFADYSANWPNNACCKEAMTAARACAVACRACGIKQAA